MNLAKQIIADRIQICQQPKKRRRCDPTCQEHLFSLTRTHRSTHQLDTLVNFCPKIHRGNQPQEATHPEFNHDRLYYTSAFVLGVDKKIIEQTRQQQLTQHIRIVKETNEKNCKVLFPKPSSKHSICSVCKVSYDNHYYAHILSDYHKERIRNSIYNQYIQQLTANFEQLHPPKDLPLSSPFQLPNHISAKAQDQTNTTESPNDQEAHLFDAHTQHTPFLEEQARGKRGKKSTKRSQKNQPAYPAEKVAIKGQLGEFTFHKITSFTLKNGQVIELAKQNNTADSKQIDHNCSQEGNNPQKNEKRQKKIVKKGSRPRGRPKKYPLPILKQIKPNLECDPLHFEQANQIQCKELGSGMKIASSNEQSVAANRLTITQLNLMDELSSQSQTNNLREINVEKECLLQTHQLEEFSQELKNALTPNQWIQLQLNSAEKELAEQEEAKLGLLSFSENEYAETQNVSPSQNLVLMEMSHQSKQCPCEFKQASNPAPKQVYTWEKMGISIQQFIRIKLSAMLNQQQGAATQPQPQPQPTYKGQHEACLQTAKNNSLIISNKPQHKVEEPSSVIELSSDSIDESSSQGDFDEKSDWKQYFDTTIIKEKQPLKVNDNNSRKRKMKFNGPVESPWKKIIVSNGIVKNCIKPQPALDTDSDIDSDEAELSDWRQQFRNVSIYRDRPYISERQGEIIDKVQFQGLLSRKNKSCLNEQKKKYDYEFC